MLKASKVYLPATYTSRSQFPDYLWVEGISVSSSLRDVTLALEYTIGGKVFDDKINLTVVQVDLDMSGVSDSEETYKGGFIALNDDDDDTQVDKDDGTVAGEIDLMGIHLNILPSLTIGQVKLEATDGSSKIDLWDGINKGPGHHITLPKTWDLSSESLPAATWGVEGINTSSSLRDVELKLSYIKDSSTIHSDIVKFTVIDVDFVEDTSQTYGFDEYTDPFYPHKSVKNSDSDTAKAQIAGASLASSVYFVHTTGTSIIVSPSQASSSPQTVTFTGIAEGFSVIWAKLNSSGAYGTNAAVIGVPAYNEDSYTLAVRVVHETSYTSTDPYTEAELQNYLNNTIYNQAIVNWTVTKHGDIRVHFDLDDNLMLDTSSWATAEMNFIINNCDPPGNYDKVIFIVNRPNPVLCGCTIMGGKYAFVFPDVSNHDERTTAHELGHAAFSLGDLKAPASNDHQNVMWETDEYNGEKLRFSQWEQIQ